jgi:hypothetical protein
VIVLLVWVAAVVLAAVLAGVLAFEVAGHLGRLRAAVTESRAAVTPQVRRVLDALPGTGGSPGRHSATTYD